jgi:hypothetical protein
MLRKTYRTKEEEVKIEWRILHNGRLHCFGDIIKVEMGGVW